MSTRKNSFNEESEYAFIKEKESIFDFLTTDTEKLILSSAIASPNTLISGESLPIVKDREDIRAIYFLEDKIESIIVYLPSGTHIFFIKG